MAGTSSGGSRRERESDSMEVLKPLVVLALFGMILYGAYSVVQKGPSAEHAAAASGLADAPPYRAPEVVVPAPQPMTAPPAAVPSGGFTQAEPPQPLVAPPAPVADPAPTYLAAEAAPPPSVDRAMPAAAVESPPANPVAAVVVPPPPQPAFPAVDVQPQAPPATLADRSAAVAVPGDTTATAFASAWADAHDKLAAGRFAEALTALSVWYDDPALGLEESQRLEDLLGQLAGTVIYSQQDLLLPPHVVAAGETLAAVAAPLGVSPELLAKINGVDDPLHLVPGEHLKLIRGPFDAVVSVSRRRISLQLNGAYAGSFPAVVGRRFLDKVGASLPVLELERGAAGPLIPAGTGSARRGIVLGDGLVIEAMDDPAIDAAPQTSLVTSVRDLDELLDILGPASRVLVRQ